MKSEKSKDMVTITRKIELQILEKDEDKINECYQRLFDWRRDVCLAANMVVNHQYFNHVFTSRVKNTIDEQLAPATNAEKTKEEKSKEWKVAAKMVENIYDNSMMNSTYTILSEKFPNLPSYVRSALNMQVSQKFNSDLGDVLKGKKSIANYKFGMPIPFSFGSESGKRLSVQLVDEKEEVVFNFLRDMTFVLRFGADKSGNRIIVDRVMSGEYKFCDSSISVEEKKLFVNLVVQHQKNNVKLDYDKVLATNLGMNCPVFITTTDKHKQAIGSKQEFWNVRMQFQRRYSALQCALTQCKAGHGRDRKLKALDRLKDVERNFAKTYNHKLSKEIVMYCLKNGIGTIKTEDLFGGAKTLEKSIILRNWSYFQLQSFLEYKANMYNIRVVKVSCSNITRMCNCCKNVSKEAVNIEERLYRCDNSECAQFKLPVDIDENASLNVLCSETIAPEKKKKKKILQPVS